MRTLTHAHTHSQCVPLSLHQSIMLIFIPFPKWVYMSREREGERARGRASEQKKGGAKESEGERVCGKSRKICL